MATTNFHPTILGAKMATRDYPLTQTEHKLIHFNLIRHWRIKLRWLIENPTALGRRYGNLHNMLWDYAIENIKPQFQDEDRWMKAVGEIIAHRFADLPDVCKDVEFFMDCHFHTLIPTPGTEEKMALIEKHKLFDQDYWLLHLGYLGNDLQHNTDPNKNV